MNTKSRGFAAVEFVLIVAVVVLIGGGLFYVYSKSSNNSKVANTTETETTELKALPDDLAGILTLEKIQELVEQEAPNTSVKAVELGVEDGVLVYIVGLSDGSQLAFDATSGEKVAVAKASDDEDEEQHTLTDLTSKVSLANAVSIARAQHPGVDVRKVEIEQEDGILVYSVRFTDKARVDVDANNGSVIEIREKDGKKVKDRDESHNDDDHDDDGAKNHSDNDDDNDGKRDRDDEDDDQDEVKDSEDRDDDNDDVDDEDDDDSGEDEDEEEEDEDEQEDDDDNSGSH